MRSAPTEATPGSRTTSPGGGRQEGAEGEEKEGGGEEASFFAFAAAAEAPLHPALLEATTEEEDGGGRFLRSREGREAGAAAAGDMAVRGVFWVGGKIRRKEEVERCVCVCALVGE